MLEWIAMLTMITDHIGYKFFPQTDIFRIVGRIAFPIYVFLVVKGLTRTSSQKQYLTRLLILAIISQIPYQLYFETIQLNVIFLLLFAAVTLKIYERLQTYLGVLWLIGSGFSLFLLSDFIDYGFYGYLLFLIFYFFQSSNWTLIVSHLLLDSLFNWYSFHDFFSLQSFSLLGTLVIVIRSSFPDVRISRWGYRVFYPAHLISLYIISLITERW